MVMKVQIRGAKKTKNFLVNLSPQMNKEMIRKSEEFSRFVQKSAKLHAPRMTGRLADSIIVKKTKNNEIRVIVGHPAGIFQEEGFTAHWVHSDMSDRMGGTIGGLFGRQGFFFVSKSKPFMKPALEAGISRLPQMVNQGAVRAIRKAEGKR